VKNISLEDKPDNCHLAHHKSHKFLLGMSTKLRHKMLTTLTALATSRRLSSYLREITIRNTQTVTLTKFNISCYERQVHKGWFKRGRL